MYSVDVNSYASTYALQQLPAIDCNTFNGIAYVNGSTTGADDGNSRADAFTDLKLALLACEACPGSIDIIRLEKSTYYPTPGGTNWDASFWIPDGVVVLGGFPTGGGALSENQAGIHGGAVNKNGSSGLSSPTRARY